MNRASRPASRQALVSMRVRPTSGKFHNTAASETGCGCSGLEWEDVIGREASRDQMYLANWPSPRLNMLKPSTSTSADTPAA